MTTPRKKVAENIYYCRCCNSITNPLRHVYLFGKKSLNEGLVPAIKKLAGIVVSIEDELPHYICRACTSNITNLSKKVTEFRNLCNETAKKQNEQICSIREKRGRKDSPKGTETEQSPLPQQPRKKPSVGTRVAQSLEERFRRIANKPGPLPLTAPLQATLDQGVGQHEVRTVVPTLQPEQPHSRHHRDSSLVEELEIISKSGLLGIKVCNFTLLFLRIPVLIYMRSISKKIFLSTTG
jgi:hypothetical protein